MSSIQPQVPTAPCGLQPDDFGRVVSGERHEAPIIRALRKRDDLSFPASEQPPWHGGLHLPLPRCRASEEINGRRTRTGARQGTTAGYAPRSCALLRLARGVQQQPLDPAAGCRSRIHRSTAVGPEARRPALAQRCFARAQAARARPPQRHAIRPWRLAAGPAGSTKYN